MRKELLYALESMFGRFAGRNPPYVQIGLISKNLVLKLRLERRQLRNQSSGAFWVDWRSREIVEADVNHPKMKTVVEMEAGRRTDGESLLS